ncbi:MAG: RHS repeat protein, partial [bacterium]|nr:RHS repeat protein [bacterium]
SYDVFGRSLVTTDERTGDTEVMGRHDNGAVTSVETNNGADTTSYTYDSMGRVTVTTLPDGTTTHNSYTIRGETLATWGSQTYARLYQYDTLGRMSELRTYQDLTHGTEPEVTTPGFALTTWHYDGQRGWLTEKNYDGETGNGPGNVPDYAYTPSGRLKTRTWERGVVTTYEYDQGALGNVTYSNDQTGTPSIEYIYDDFGRPVTVNQDASPTHGANSHTYVYDPDDLTLETETIKYDIDANGVAALTRVLVPTKDSLLRPTGYALKDGATVEHATTYTYDLAGRLRSVSETHQSPALDFVYNYEPDSASLVESVVGPVHMVENTYEPHRNVLVTKENSITATNEVISNFVYTTNNIGQRKTLTTSGSAYAA